MAGQQVAENGAARWSWRVLVAAPSGGFGAQLRMMHTWLDQNCGPTGWALAPAGTGGIVNDAVAFCFADAAVASGFVERFCCGYRTTP